MMFGFNHSLVVGCTGSGKTYLMKRMASGLLNKKQQVIVFTTADASEWDKRAHVIDEIDGLELLLNKRALAGAYVFIDEALDFFDDIDKKKHKMCDRLHRKGRHRGFKVFFMTQDYIGVPKQVRRNVKEVYIFSTGSDDIVAKQISREYNGVDTSRFGLSLEMLIKNLNDYRFLNFKLGGKVKCCKI